jgi:predicted alpha/beta superfamily hydrolase
MPGDIILASAKTNEYYVASALLDCIAPQASMVLRPLNDRYVFLCLHTLLSPAFIWHATRIAVETSNRRPQWKFVRKYKINIPSGEYLENANSSLNVIYTKWLERVRAHIALKQKRTDLLAEFWKKLHQ